MVEEKWKQSDVWPPADVAYRPLYLEAENTLVWRNNFSTYNSKKAELKLLGDSINHLKSTGVNKILQRLEGEGKLSQEDEAKILQYRTVENEYNRALMQLNEQAPQVKQWRDSEEEQTFTRLILPQPRECMLSFVRFLAS